MFLLLGSLFLILKKGYIMRDLGQKIAYLFLLIISIIIGGVVAYLAQDYPFYGFGLGGLWLCLSIWIATLISRSGMNSSGGRLGNAIGSALYFGEGFIIGVIVTLVGEFIGIGIVSLCLKLSG